MIRITNTVLNVMSLLLVVVGLGLVSTFLFGSPVPTQVPGGKAGVGGPQDFDVPVLAKSTEPEKPQSEPVAPLPEDKTLRITIPKMARVRDAAIPYATGNDEEALRNNVAIHLKGTGFPWQEEANVYLAGHRLGYPATASFLAFYDLGKLEKGDEVFVTDSGGGRYVYRVFRVFVVDPTDVFVTRPLEGRNIVTLQTCTLPDYSRRLIVRAERVA